MLCILSTNKYTKKEINEYIQSKIFSLCIILVSFKWATYYTMACAIKNQRVNKDIKLIKI